MEPDREQGGQRASCWAELALWGNEVFIYPAPKHDRGGAGQQRSPESFSPSVAARCPPPHLFTPSLLH